MTVLRIKTPAYDGFLIIFNTDIGESLAIITGPFSPGFLAVATD